MLDFELAEIYGYSTKAFNQQVKRNIERFEGEDFMFQLTYDEIEKISRSHFVTLNKGTGRGSNIKYRPYCFTEQGTYMLMTILKGELATRQSRALVRTFKKTEGKYHDRYIAVDYDTKMESIYHCGTSSKDAGSKITSISKIDDTKIYHPIFDDLLNNSDLLLK